MKSLSPPRACRRPRRLAFCLFPLLSFALLAAGVSAKRNFSLPGDFAFKTLKQFSEQAGVQLLFPTEMVEGIRTNAVQGELTPIDALQRMLAGTALAVVHDEKTGSLGVKRTNDPNAERAAPRTTSSDRPNQTENSEAGQGSIEGRISSATNGQYLNRVRVSIDALRLETFTDQYGHYRLPQVPAGDLAVRVYYTGFPAEVHAVTVPAGGRVHRDFILRPANDDAGETTVRLDAFTVAATRDMAASDVAVNEQRFAQNIKSVVSTDSFGDIAEGNVGEFVKFLPGVNVNRDGNDGRSISIGGIPASSTPITIDGNAVASAASSNPTRVVELEQIAINNMSRVEITRSQNPDTPANAIGGTVNLVSKSAFERTRPQYIVKAYAAFREGELKFKETPGPLAGRSHPVQPNYELSAIVPLTANFGISVSGLNSRVITNSQSTNRAWVPHGLAVDANFPATPADRPYLGRYTLADNPKLNVRQSIGLTADYRLTPKDVISLGFQYSYFFAEWWGRTLTLSVGRAASFGSDFTQGAAGAGTARQTFGGRDKRGTTAMPSLRYRHTGRVWKFELGGAYSRATNHYRDLDKGYWMATDAFIRNVTVRFDGVGYVRPETITALNAAGAAVDPFAITNYRLESGLSNQYDAEDLVRSAYANMTREFGGRVPLTVKAGIDFRSQSRDMVRPSRSFTYIGADRTANTADDNAGQWFDPIFSQRRLPEGFPQMQWMDLAAIGQTFKEHPEYFTYTEAQAVTYHRNVVNTSQAITEDILAPYLRFDTRLLENRLTVTGGVRYERTADDGVGGLIDPSRIYQRNTAGNIIRNAAGQPVVIAPLASLAGTQLAYVERGAHTKKSYGEFFPSVNASFNIRPSLIGRVSFARSIARPDFNNILPAANIPDPTTSARTITITNPDLTPWTANSYGVSLEWYFHEPSTGVISVRGFRRDISDFWGTKLTPATDELLDLYGLDPTVYGAALGYNVSTSLNSGDAQVTGLELDYRQNLDFLPRWARGITVFGNLTSQHLSGATTADFTGFVRETINYGVSFNRARWTLRANVNLRGLQRGASVNTAGAEPGTYVYMLPRRSLDVTAEFRLTRHFSLFANGRNANGAYDDTVTYGPSTPRYSILTTRADYRAYWNVGVKGTF